MCVSPCFIYDDVGEGFQRLEVPCGWCWSCQKNRLNDLVARCMCEAATSDWVLAVTLSYRPPWPNPMTPQAEEAGNQRYPEPIQTRVICKEDFQNFQKHLRRRFKTRYLVAGEYGSRGTRRTHFHVVLFGRGVPPSWELNKNTHIDQWPWGHVYVQSDIDERTIRYCAKYLLKGAKRKKTMFDHSYNKEWISYSRIPIMGIDFVKDLAARYAAEKVFPHSFKYRPPFAHERREYEFRGEACKVFFDLLLELWPEAAHAKKNERMEKAFARWVKDRQRKRWEALPHHVREKLLDTEYAPKATLNQRDLRLYGRYLWERLHHGSERLTIEEFASRYPDDYSEVRAVYRRDLVAYPPTYAESGVDFSA